MKKEEGMTLVEVLATLVLVTLVTAVIWTTISIATKFSVSETSSLKLQQEANYIISELQRVHRKCGSYQLIIRQNEVEVLNCRDREGVALQGYDSVISNVYQYAPISNLEEDEDIITTEENLEIFDFKVSDPVNSKRSISLPISISRYKTD